MQSTLQDLRWAARSLRKTPRFTAAAVLALAVGIGGSTSLFSVVDAVLLKPLRLPEPERLVQVSQSAEDGSPSGWAPSSYQDLARETGAIFDGIAAWYPRSGNLSGPAGAEHVSLGAVTARFFPTLGVAPAFGRDFQPGEDLAGQDQVLIVSDRFFRSALGGSLGGTVLLDDRRYTVIGVLPAGFRFPRLEEVDGFVPIGFNATDLANRGSQYLRAVARLRPGVALAQAQARLAPIGARIAERDDVPQRRSATVQGLQAAQIAPARPLLGLLFAAVLVVLLIACANVTGLLLARGVARQREVAIRAALGGTRGRIVRQLLTESLLIALAGGALGLLLAAWSTNALVAAAPPGSPRLDEATLDGRVAAFSIGAALVSAVLAGLWPAVQASRSSPADSLRDSSRNVADNRRKARARSALVVGQIALALVLLAGAGLVVRSFQRIASKPLGFEPARVLTARIPMPLRPLRWRSPGEYAAFYAELARRVAALPGVESVSASTLGPLDELGAWNNEFTIDGRAPASAGEGLWAMLNWATPRFFSTLGMRLAEGRFFDESDRGRYPAARSRGERSLRAKILPGVKPGRTAPATEVRRQWPVRPPRRDACRLALPDRRRRRGRRRIRPRPARGAAHLPERPAAGIPADEPAREDPNRRSDDGGGRRAGRASVAGPVAPARGGAALSGDPSRLDREPPVSAAPALALRRGGARPRCARHPRNRRFQRGAADARDRDPPRARSGTRRDAADGRRPGALGSPPRESRSVSSCPSQRRARSGASCTA